MKEKPNNNNQNTQQTLSNLGLTDKEAKFYLALLETGPSTILPIAQKAGLKRTSAYNFIDRLVELGLVSFFVKNNRHYYRAEHPEHMRSLLQKRQKEFSNILPDLTKAYESHAQHPETKMFYGVEGMKKTLLEALECEEKKIYAIIDIDSAVENLGVKFWEEYIDEMTNRGIIGHSLRHHEEKNRIPEYGYLKKEQYQKTLLIPRYLPRKVTFPNTLLIYDTTIAIISPQKENWALVIKSPSLSEGMKNLHNLLWEISR